MKYPKRQALHDDEWARAEQEDRAEWATRLTAMRANIGGTARKRERAREQLAWLLDSFLYRDLRAIGQEEEALRLSLSLLIADVTGDRWRPPTEQRAPTAVRPPTRAARILARVGLGSGQVMVRVAGQDLAEVQRAQA